MPRIFFTCLFCLIPTVAWGQASLFDQAIRLFSDVLHAEPGNGNALALRGCAFIGKKEFGKALADCEQALKLDTKNVEALVQRGRTLGAMHKVNDALADFNDAIRLDSKSAKAFRGRSVSYFSLGKKEQAHFQDITKAIQLDPKTAGIILFERKCTYGWGNMQRPWLIVMRRSNLILAMSPPSDHVRAFILP